MKVGIVSDIHCNIAGLDIALERMGDIDELICAGDSVYQFRFSNEVVERLRERGAHQIWGNHEEVLLGPHGERARQATWIHRDTLEYLQSRPMNLSLTLGSKRIRVVHGSPWEPYNEYIYPHSPSLGRFVDFDADVVIMGHTHCQMSLRVGRTLVLNPGSAGESRDSTNGFQLSCAILDTETDEVELINYPDPTRAVAVGSDATATMWTPQSNGVPYAYDLSPKNKQDPWNASLNT